MTFTAVKQEMTTATIAIEYSDGSIKSVYVNADGYPDHTGYILYKYYNNINKVSRLIELGNIVYLGKYIDHTIGEVDSSNDDLYTIFYIRDKRSDYYTNIANRYDSIDDMLKNYSSTDYVYLYTKDHVWYMYDRMNHQWDEIKPSMFDNYPETNDPSYKESYI